MIAKVVTSGSGFRGLADYLTQDDRAVWSESRHVPTDDPRLASRMMAAVASSQADLKRAAGVSARGRKCNDPVLHLVLSWRDGETPTREEQTAAADSLLKQLSLGDRQASIVAHDDEEHRHVHVMVNRVSSQNGRAAKLGLFKRTCSQWASDYERAHRDIQCPRREEVRAAREAGRPIPPRSRPAPSVRRDRKTGRPETRSPDETALWRGCYARSLAAGDDRNQAKARRAWFSAELEKTRPARRAIEDRELPPLQPPGRSLDELTREMRRREEEERKRQEEEQRREDEIEEARERAAEALCEQQWGSWEPDPEADDPPAPEADTPTAEDVHTPTPDTTPDTPTAPQGGPAGVIRGRGRPVGGRRPVADDDPIVRGDDGRGPGGASPASPPSSRGRGSQSR